jgi:vacuolar-type H+-ATPase subunit C/Vma6
VGTRLSELNNMAKLEDISLLIELSKYFSSKYSINEIEGLKMAEKALKENNFKGENDD